MQSGSSGASKRRYRGVSLCVAVLILILAFIACATGRKMKVINDSTGEVKVLSQKEFRKFLRDENLRYNLHTGLVRLLPKIKDSPRASSSCQSCCQCTQLSEAATTFGNLAESLRSTEDTLLELERLAKKVVAEESEKIISIIDDNLGIRPCLLEDEIEYLLNKSKGKVWCRSERRKEYSSAEAIAQQSQTAVAEVENVGVDGECSADDDTIIESQILKTEFARSSVTCVPVDDLLDDLEEDCWNSMLLSWDNSVGILQKNVTVDVRLNADGERTFILWGQVSTQKRREQMKNEERLTYIKRALALNVFPFVYYEMKVGSKEEREGITPHFVKGTELLARLLDEKRTSTISALKSVESLFARQIETVLESVELIVSAIGETIEAGPRWRIV